MDRRGRSRVVPGECRGLNRSQCLELSERVGVCVVLLMREVGTGEVVSVPPEVLSIVLEQKVLVLHPDSVDLE